MADELQTSTDAGTANPAASLPDWAAYGLDTAGSADPPLPPDPAQEAAAGKPSESQQGAVESEGSPAEAAGTTEQPQAEAQPAPEAGATGAREAGAEQSKEEGKGTEDAQAQAGTEAARGFWKRYKDPATPAETVRAHLEQQSPSRYAELERAALARVAAEPERLERLFNSEGEGRGTFERLANTLCDSDPEYYLRRITGSNEVSVEQVRAALAGGTGTNASALTEDEWADLELLNPEIAAKLKSAPAPGAAPDKQAGEQGKAEKPPEPAEVIRKYQARKKAVDDAFDEGVKPVHSYVEKKTLDRFGAYPEEREFELAEDVARLKQDRLDLFLHGNRQIPPFADGMAKWAKHRKLDVGGQTLDFDQIVRRLGQFADRGEVENAAEAARELIPFADAYFAVRAALPQFKWYDRQVEAASRSANPPVHAEKVIAGRVSQPSSSAPRSLDEQLVADAVASTGHP
jgi:hypothetical protein